MREPRLSGVLHPEYTIGAGGRFWRGLHRAPSAPRKQAGRTVLFLLPVFLLAFANAAPGAIILGDVNHDDDINAQDVQLVINTVLGMDTGVDCDINRDKKTDAVDVQLVINAALGLQIGVKVPDLTGMTEGEASGALAFAYLTVGDVTSETSATVPAGQILSQDPAAGASVAPETTVAVVLSSGPPPSTGWTYIPSQTSVWGLKIEQTSDGGYVMGGGYTGGYDMYALKLTPTGAVEWDAEYSEESPNGNDLWRAEAHGLNPAGDGGYVMLSSGGFVLLKLDSQGNYVWDKSFAPDNPYTPGKPCSPTVSGELCVCSDGGFFAAGSSYVGGYVLASVLKTDAAGNLEFCRVINDNAKAYDQHIEAGQQTADGGFVISGYSANGSPHGYLALLIKLDADGLLEWSKTYQCVELGYGATSYAVTQTADGGYVLGGLLVNDITKVLNHGPFLAKTDEYGELVWMRAYGGSATVYDLRDIEETPQGDLLVCGNKSGKLILSKFTANGDLLWNFVMTELPSVVGHDLELTPDGGCIMVGSGPTGGPTVVVKINNVYLPE